MSGVCAGLLADVKNLLDITWADPATDNKIRALMEDGMFYLDNKAGRAGDFTAPGFRRTLLVEYVRYARDNALDVFETNYRDMILAMQNEEAISGAEAETLQSEGRGIAEL